MEQSLTSYTSSHPIVCRFDDLTPGAPVAWSFVGCTRIITAHVASEVMSALTEAERAATDGNWVAGFVTYEAASGIDPLFVVHAAPGLVPLVWFGVFSARETVTPIDAVPPDPSTWSVDDVALAFGREWHHKSVTSIRERIAAGDVYQVNLCDRARGTFSGDSLALYRSLAHAQRARYHAYIDIGSTIVVSASPELFFECSGGPDSYKSVPPTSPEAGASLDVPPTSPEGTPSFSGGPDSYESVPPTYPEKWSPNSGGGNWTAATAAADPGIHSTTIRTRPMKGTAGRGRWPSEDRSRAAALLDSPKERAENVMIVDLLRNDLGRIAEVGSVHVSDLFGLERYPTVWQLTSTIEATLRQRTTFVDTMRALFPCGSITGAPKIAAVTTIADLEPESRGVYCGAIGWLAPPSNIGPSARFSVAIRTAVIDVESGRLEYGAGGGITIDSEPAAEFAELRSKQRILTHPSATASILETMLWTPDEGIAFLEFHLDRMERSAEYFGHPFTRSQIRTQIVDALFLGTPDVLFGAAPVPRTNTPPLLGKGGVPESQTAPLLGTDDEPNAQHACTTKSRAGALMVRAMLSPHGTLTVETKPATLVSHQLVRLEIHRTPIDHNDPRWYHKTTDRARYDIARAEHPAADDVVFVNPDGYVTEASIYAIAALINGAWCTPRIEDGCLPSVAVRAGIAHGQLTRRSITVDEFRHAPQIAVLNAVRGWRPAELI